MDFRVGHGYDVHRLTKERRLILGGVEIPHETGLLGHSDADVLCHAIADSLLGAAGKRDIGFHFPDSEEKFRGISSLILLRQVKEMICLDGYSIGNIDATIVAQSPKLAPYVDKMRENISYTLMLDTDRVNIKATKEEKIGFTGRREGISAHSVCIIFRS